MSKILLKSIGQFFIVGLLLLCSRNSSAQEAPIYKWALKVTSQTCYAGNNTPPLTQSDAAGNVYVLGSFCNPFDADPGSGTTTLTADNSNYDDNYLIKLDPSGNFLWATRFAEAPYYNFPSALVVDASGNVFTVTHYEIGFQDFRTIISKFDASGNPVWSNRIYTAKGHAYSIILDATGNPILTGDFSSTVDFDPGAGVQSVAASGSETDFFVLKLDSDGNFLWVKSGGGSSFERGITLARDASNNIVVGGYYLGTTDLDPGAGVSNFTSVGLTDAFVLKLDNAGNFVWAKSMGGTQDDVPTSISINTSNNIFLTGYFKGTSDFDPSAGITALTSASSTGSDIFLMRLNADGSFGWASAFGGSDDDEGRGLTTDAAGNIIFTGFFNGTVDFDPGAGVRNLTSIGLNSYHSMFVAKLDQNQQLIWAKEIAGASTSRVRAYTISIDAAGDISLGGSVWGGADFDFGVCTRSLSNNPPVGFAMKIKTGDTPGPPTITSFTPTAGSAGTTVVITGTNFSPVPSENLVQWFSPLRTAVVTASTTTTITTTVPIGANTSKIYVTVGCYPIAISPNNFTVGIPVLPTITSFTPSSGPVGTAVTITGTNFSTTPSGNIVFFGATKATVTAATTTQLTVTVPSGATYKPITVLVNGLQAYSSKPFVVTFAGGGSLNTNSFAPKVDFITGTSPRSVSIGDMDGDGKADMAITSVFSNAISVYRNTSAVVSITFAAKVDFSTGASSNPYCVAIGDLDGDGKQDMAVVNYNTNTLSVLRNTSSGAGTISFATKVDFTTGSFPRFVSIGDLDADGKPDLVVSNAGSNTISIFRNTSASAGTISYAAKADLTGTTGGMSVVINDLDGDGRRDLAVANWVNPGAITTYRNITTVPGSISFAAKVDFPTGHNFLWSIAAGDLDNDGRSDLATPIASVVTLLRNSSTSGSVNFGTVVDLVATPYASFISIDDLNGDGKVDLTVSNDSNGSVSVFENTSSGAGSIAFGANADFPTGTHPVSNAIADIDGDGRADLVVPNHDANTVSVLRNIMAATLSPTISSFTPNSGPVGTTVTLTGTNFSTTPTNNTVTFNGTAATVSASTATSITVTVPPNATTGKITVTVAGNTATSTTDFTVTTGTAINITTQPSSSSVCSNASATFTTAATGTTNITYQWQFATSLAGTYSNISNGSGYVNATTASLSVNTTGNFGGGFYRCQISGDMATAIFTNGVQLTITTCTSNQPPDIQSTTIEAPVNGKVTLDLAALLSDPDDNLDLSTLKIIVPPLSGATATIDGQSNLILDYTGISFTGTEKLTIEVCDLSGSCAQNELDIEVAGDVVVYNAVSPNGDGKNDFLFLQHVDLLEETKENHVTILNRWGSVVWEGDNYDNTSVVFSGQSKNGNDLPSGNYFYRIEFGGNYKKRSGFLALKR